MMTWLVAQARERGEPVAVLGASEAAIYQRFGYGIGTLQTQFEIESSSRDLPRAGRDARTGPLRRCG